MIAKEYIDGHGVKHPYLTVLLGIVFVAQWLLTVGYTGGQKAAGHDARGPAEPAKPCGVSKSPNPQGLSPPRATLWLTPYVTTRWRKAAALAVYLITLGLQLLEGYWMMELLGTATARWFRLWLGLVGVEAWFYAAFVTLVLASNLVMDAVVLFAGALVVLLQGCCIVELCCFSPARECLKRRESPQRGAVATRL